MVAKKKAPRRRRARGGTAKTGAQKFGDVLWAAGWTGIPTTFLQRQRTLGLNAVDLAVLVHLLSYWWYADQPPYPSKAAIADCLDCSEKTVQRSLRRMERKGLVRRRQRTGYTSLYDFSGLIRKATPLAEEDLESRQRRKREQAHARRRAEPRERA